MGLILDTNALSALAAGDHEAGQEVARADRVYIPVIVLGEYRFGISQLRSNDEHARWLARMLSVCPALYVDDETATWYAEVRSRLKKAGTPIPSNDLWIAALCRQHRLPLLSRDRHFDSVSGLQRVEW